MYENDEYFEERRLHERQLRVFKPAYIESDGKSLVGMLRDLSSTGAGIEVGEHDFRIGQPVEYRWGNQEKLSGEVVWANGGRIGVAHHATNSNFEGLLERYRSVRIPLTTPAKIYVDGRRHAAETLNFAQKGFCALVGAEIRQGALATIEIGRRCFQGATAKWVDGEKVGFALGQTMSIGEMNALQRGV